MTREISVREQDSRTGNIDLLSNAVYAYRQAKVTQKI